MGMYLKQTMTIIGLLAINVTAMAEVKCNADSSSCFFDNMPIYDQKDPDIGKDLLPRGASNSMLCGPTSGAMALQAIVNNLAQPTQLNSGSWTAKSFIAATPAMKEKDRAIFQIRAMSKKMGTSPTAGTYTNQIGSGVGARAADFTKKVAKGVTTGYPVSYPFQNYADYLSKEKSAVVMMYGYYNRSSKTSNGKTYYSYARNGGHFVTVNGFNKDKLLIYNPIDAVKNERSVTIVKNGCAGTVCENLPGGLKQRSLLFISGTYRFIDMHSRIGLL